MEKSAASGSGTLLVKEETSERDLQSFPRRGHESKIKGREDDFDKENLLEKCLTAEDVRRYRCLIIAANDAEKFSPFAAILDGAKFSRLSFEDEKGKSWKIYCSYRQEGYFLGFGWRSYVRTKQLRGGDFVFFQRHRTDSRRLFIGCRRRDHSDDALEKQNHILPASTVPTTFFTEPGVSSLNLGSFNSEPTLPTTLFTGAGFSSLALDDFDSDPALTTASLTEFGDSSLDTGLFISDPTFASLTKEDFSPQNFGYFDSVSTSLATFFPYTDPFLEDHGYVLPVPTAPFTSAKKIELTEKLKEVETPLQLGLPEHSKTGFNPVLVIFCGDNQDSEETYFISYILNELCLRGFSPLRYDLTKSTVTGNQEMLYRSRVGILIFSMNCTRSSQYLDQCTAIKDYLTANNLITVSFKESHSNIRHGSGSFERVFSRLVNSVQASRVRKWRAAMIELNSINRYQYMKGDEVMLAKNIVRDVSFLLGSETNRNLKGLGLQLKSILSLLNCSQSSSPHIVGLWGMAGIGKTTIATEIFRTQAERYDICYFLPDFHLMCQTKGLSHLRDEFFLKIFGETEVFIDTCDTKLSFTRDRFRDKRVLIVLDDVGNARDAEVLVGGFGWFSGGHTILLTSRNRQILVQCNAKEVYQIPVLSEPESFCLCSQYEENWTKRVSLISQLVNYASGNPLALQVLSSSIQSKNCIDDERQYLSRLRQYPPIEIQDAFRRSFNGLDDDEKNIFLDLACFFRGENKDHVVNILDGCGFLTDLGICGLIDESLISLVDNKIEMPNIFQDMGRFVVCQEYEEAGKRSRLWDSNDIADMLTNNTGTEAIEGMFLDVSGLTFELRPTVFERMYRLRLFKLQCRTFDNNCKLYLPQGLYSLPDELRLLHWERYPLGSLPKKFNPKNLVELNMPYSNLTRLWKGTKNLEKLKKITLSHSRQLNKFPRLSKAMNLERIDFEGCTSLVKVNSSILHHHKLTFLSLKDCSHLRIMPATVHLDSLEVLNLSGCSELEDLKDFSPNLKELYLAGTAIRELPLSLENLARLVTLDLENCVRLQYLPLGIINLRVTLKLSGCSNLKSLPIRDAFFLRDPQHLNRNLTTKEVAPFRLHSAIQESRFDGSEILLDFGILRLGTDSHGTHFRQYVEYENFLPIFESWPQVVFTLLPSSILPSLASRLYALVSLFLYDAYLVDIPEDLCWFALVKTLDFGGNSFSHFPKRIKELRKLHSLRLRNCKKLKSLPELPRSLEVLDAHGCVSLESFPSDFEQFPRHYTFSNCFDLSPEAVREFIRKFQFTVEGMARRHQLEHHNVPSFSIFMPASADYESLIDFQAGSSVRMWLTADIVKTVIGFTLSVVVEFRDNYRNTAGFGIKCICRKSRISPAQERTFYCWDSKEAPAVHKDHMLVFGCADVEEIDCSFLGGMVTFEFYPVNWENKHLDDCCTVKKCGVSLITATSDTTLSIKRRSSMDPEESSTVEHMAPPCKKGRLKSVTESVVPTLRKRKREECVSTPRSLAERTRRREISERLKRLQELVPNMDKQTSHADKLDIAVDYIEDLERKRKVLMEKRANCRCLNKEKKGI